MATKQARGIKRTCQSCEERFYDLDRDPIVCPYCGEKYIIASSPTAVAEMQAEEKAALKKAKKVVSDDDDVDDDDLPEVGDDDSIDDSSDDSSDDDTFLEDEDEGGGDVSGIIGGVKENGDNT